MDTALWIILGVLVVLLVLLVVLVVLQRRRRAGTVIAVTPRADEER